jgi:predicted acylesterase/phospholipase RssA
MKSRWSSNLSRRFLFCSVITAVIALSNVAVYAQAQAQESKPEAEQTAQIQPGTSRPKIGVALEGGGALGLAHIGVLQWFEDHHIPIDYLAGTSMGGLVGGLYATGKSPEELREIVAAQKWDIIIGGDIPYQDLSYRRKEDLRYIQNSLKLGLKHGLSTPSGLNSGTEISLLIDRETVSYPSLDSFDHLPIPFRCVATDLISGKEVVFSSGSLQQALRATMSMPGVFSPVRDGDKIYVDGGLVGNLPTDVVKKNGRGHRDRSSLGGRAGRSQTDSVTLQRAGTLCGRRGPRKRASRFEERGHRCQRSPAEIQRLPIRQGTRDYSGGNAGGRTKKSGSVTILRERRRMERLCGSQGRAHPHRGMCM